MLLLALVLAQMMPGTKLLDPISHKQVTVFPVVRPQTSDVRPQEYLTLKEGLSDRLVAVSERGDVNHVSVQNKGDLPLLLVGGEMILGGQQDRIIGQDQLVPPHRTQVVQVFCVEHGRWSGSGRFGSAGGIVDAKVRAKAKLHADQQGVWDEVAKRTATLKAETPTGTYRAIAGNAEKDLKPYRDAIAPALAKLPGVVGLATAVNGRILSVDVFGSPELFAQYRDRILDSAFVSAVSAGEDPAAAKPTPAAVESFVGKERGSVVNGRGATPVMQSIQADAP